MYVDKGRWTCPDLVELKAGTLELEIKELLWARLLVVGGVSQSSLWTDRTCVGGEDIGVGD